RIVGPDGAVLSGSSAFAWPPTDPDATEARFADVADPAGGHWRAVTRVFEVEDERGRGGRRERETRVAVQVAGEAAPFGALEERFRRGLVIALAAALVMGGAGAALLAYVSLAPLRRLAAEVDAMGAAS